MKRIVTVLMLLLCSLSGFAQFTLNGADDYLRQKAEVAEKQRIQDSIRQVQLEEQQLMAKDVRFRIKWVNMITYRQSIGVIENAYNLSYYGYMVTKDAWTFPISLRLTGAEKFNESAMNTGFSSWSQHLTDIGMSGFRKIKGNEYFSLGLHVPLGYEKYKLVGSTAGHFRLLIGASAEERLMYISPNKTGLVMSVGFYQLMMSSKRYSFDAGFSLEVGIKF
ncbi:MAG TPA: hypothetical protein VFP20_04370 [Bacteroidales bacterium]|nr:hypothetical protein [Bacteroidales bacterium]